MIGLSSSFNDKQEPGLLSVCIEPWLLISVFKNEKSIVLFIWSVSFISRLTLSVLNGFIGWSSSLGSCTSMAMSCNLGGCQWAAETCVWEQLKNGRDPKQDHIYHRCVCESINFHLIHSISSIDNRCQPTATDILSGVECLRSDRLYSGDCLRWWMSVENWP